MRREVIGVERKKRQGDNRGKHDGKGNGVGGKKGELIASTKYYSYLTATESTRGSNIVEVKIWVSLCVSL